MPNPISNAKPEKSFLFLLALITLLAAGLRLYRADDPLWVDELHTAWTVSDNLDQVAPRAARGNQSPVFFYAVWASTRMLGMSEVAIRLPSLVLGILFVPLAGAVVWRWTSSVVAGLLAATLCAIDRDFLFYAQEARAYVAVQFIGLVQVFAFARLIRGCDDVERSVVDANRFRIVFVATSVLIFYLHYTAILLLAGELVCYLILCASRRWLPEYRWKRLALDLSIIAILCLPALPHLREIAERRENWQPIVQAKISAGLLRLEEVYVILPLALLAVFQLSRLATRRRFAAEPIDLRLTVLVGCWLTVPVGIAWLATVADIASLFMLRYVIVSALATIVVASLCCTICPSGTIRGVFAILVLCGAVITSDIPQQFYKHGKFNADRNEDWPSVVQMINESTTTARWPVILCPDLIEDHGLVDQRDKDLHEFCLFPITGLYRVDAGNRQLIALPTRVVNSLSKPRLQLIANKRGAWLIVRGDKKLAVQIADSIADEMQRHGVPSRIDVRYSKGAVKLIEINVQPVARSEP